MICVDIHCPSTFLFSFIAFFVQSIILFASVRSASLLKPRPINAASLFVCLPDAADNDVRVRDCGQGHGRKWGWPHRNSHGYHYHHRQERPCPWVHTPSGEKQTPPPPFFFLASTSSELFHFSLCHLFALCGKTVCLPLQVGQRLGSVRCRCNMFFQGLRTHQLARRFAVVSTNKTRSCGCGKLLLLIMELVVLKLVLLSCADILLASTHTVLLLHILYCTVHKCIVTARLLAIWQ